MPTAVILKTNPPPSLTPEKEADCSNNNNNIGSSSDSSISNKHTTLVANSGNDFENRSAFSHWRNVDNDSADITSAGKLFHNHYKVSYHMEK